MTTGYALNETVWFKGDEYKIISEPVKKFGLGKFQHARAIEGTKVIWVPTPESLNANIGRDRKDYKDMQDGFRRLKKIS